MSLQFVLALLFLLTTTTMGLKERHQRGIGSFSLQREVKVFLTQCPRERNLFPPTFSRNQCCEGSLVESKSTSAHKSIACSTGSEIKQKLEVCGKTKVEVQSCSVARSDSLPCEGCKGHVHPLEMCRVARIPAQQQERTALGCNESQNQGCFFVLLNAFCVL